MSNDAKSPPPGPAKPAKATSDTQPAKQESVPPLALDERRYKYAELAKLREILSQPELIAMLRDGRAVVRANAALGLAALGHALGDLVPLLRDSEHTVAVATAEAIGKLGLGARADPADRAGARHRPRRRHRGRRDLARGADGHRRR